MGLQNLNTCIGAYYCDATGYDTGSKKLIDKSGYGNDLTLRIGSAPVYATRAGFQVMDFDNTYYFDGPDLWTSGGSVVFVGVCDMSGADGSQFPVRTLSRYANAGDFAGVDISVNTDWDAGAYGRKSIYFNTNSPTVFDLNGGVNASGTTWTAGAMNLFTASAILSPSQVQASTKLQVQQITPYTYGATAAQSGSTMRIGFTKSSGTITGGKYLSAKRVYFFSGNVFDHPSFTTERVNEIAVWGI